MTGENASDIDPADAVAVRVQERFQESGTGTTHFYISKDSSVFNDRVAKLFGKDTTATFRKEK